MLCDKTSRAWQAHGPLLASVRVTALTRLQPEEAPPKQYEPVLRPDTVTDMATASVRQELPLELFVVSGTKRTASQACVWSQLS
jgi:hypothetical protein